MYDSPGRSAEEGGGMSNPPTGMIQLAARFGGPAARGDDHQLRPMVHRSNKGLKVAKVCVNPGPASIGRISLFFFFFLNFFLKFAWILSLIHEARTMHTGAETEFIIHMGFPFTAGSCVTTFLQTCCEGN